jgi:Ca2+-binding EF-hand superfamily protein
MNDGFTSSDKDKDGTLTREEAVAAYGDRGGKYFDALDTAKTGSIAMAALEKDAEEAFSWADADGNGSITAAEKSAATAEHTEAEAQQKANPKAKAAKLARKMR